MKNFTFLSREVCAFVRPHTPHLLLSFLCFFIALSSSWAQSSEQAIEVRLQSGQTATRQIIISNPGSGTVTYETAIRETNESLTRRYSAPILNTPTEDNDRQKILYATGFEDYTLGDLVPQQGWTDNYFGPLTGTTPAQAFVREDNPFSGEKHLALNIDTALLTFSVTSPSIDKATSFFASYVVNVKRFDDQSELRIFTRQEDDGVFGTPETTSGVYIFMDGSLGAFDYELDKRVFTSRSFKEEDGYVEIKYVVNRMTNVFDVYLNGLRVLTSLNALNGTINELELAGIDLEVDESSDEPSLLVDDIKVIDGDAAAPLWVSTPVFSGTLPAQGQNTLDIAIDAGNLAPGTYEANIQVVTPDFTSITTVPVTLVVEEPQPTVVNKLNLTSMCSDNPEEELRWRIRNPNDFAVEVSWQVYGTPQQDVVMAPPGDSFFFTQTNEGPNTTIIRWKDEEGRNRQKIKASGKAACQPPQPELQVYPVPVREALNIMIENADKGVITIRNQNGKSVYRQEITANQTLNLKASKLKLVPQQLYTIALQTEDSRVVRRVMIE